MRNAPYVRRYRGMLSIVVAGALLTGCTTGQFSTRAQRIGPDDGSDTCRPYVVALDSTGDYFGADIAGGAALGALGGAAIGGLATGNLRGAALGALAGAVAGGAGAYWMALQQQNLDQTALNRRIGSDLVRENGQIDKTQIAFDQLNDCRFRQASQIRADYRAHRIDRASADTAMADIRQRAQRDLSIAQSVDRQIQDRGQQFAMAAGNVAQGGTTSPASVQSAPMAVPRSAPVPAQSATVRHAAPLKVRPDASAPDIARVSQREQVRVIGGRNGYASVETASGTRGYLAANELDSSAARRTVAADSSQASSNSGDVRTLAGSNAARRDDFAQSVAVAQSAQASGFELAAG